MIYILMRMVEGPTDNNDIDIPLLLTFNVCKAFATLLIYIADYLQMY